MQIQFDEKKYSALLERIFAITPSVQSVGFAPDAYKPGLGGMRAFDEKLGHPWKRYKTIHVAGTNGKGSVASMLASALAAGDDSHPGVRVGLYTSPHLVDFRERMKIVCDDGWSMPEKEEVWEFFQTFDTAGLSFFEMTTGLALWWFARQKADVAIIEVGLGGRLDSTNIICPELCAVTSIGLDHCALLGNTRAEIAREKAGIFKPEVPAVVGTADPETEPVFRKAAEAAGAPLFFADSVPGDSREDGILSRMDLCGPCQKENLHTVLVCLGVLNGGTPVSEQTASAIENTAARTGLHGRWEKLCTNPEVICDIGHNPPALEINFERLNRLAAASPDGEPARKVTIVYGIMADKDLDGIAPLMPPQADYILVAPDIPRALPQDRLLERLRGLRGDLDLKTAESVAAGIELAVARAGNCPPGAPEPLIYIGGSTFVVTEAIEYFNKRQ